MKLLRPASLLTVALLGLAACDHNNRTGAAESQPTVGQSIGNAADNAKQSMDNAGTKVRDAVDPPRGPAESAGRSIDRAFSN